jgi:hypothetical protein
MIFAYEQWIVCTNVNINVFITLGHLEYHCKAFFETPALSVEVTLNANYPRRNSVCFATLSQFKTLYMFSE